MSESLPKWIHDAFGRSFECSDGEKLENAFSIAYQALEAIRWGSLEANFEQCLQSEREVASDAMDKIDALGGEDNSEAKESNP